MMSRVSRIEIEEPVAPKLPKPGMWVVITLMVSKALNALGKSQNLFTVVYFSAGH